MGMGDGIEGEASVWATASVSRLARGKGVDKGGGGYQEQRASRGASHVPVKYRDLAQVLGIGDDWAWVNAWGTQRTSPKRVQVICTQPMICSIKCHT